MEQGLIRYGQVLRKRWAIIVAIPVIAGLTSGILSFMVIDPVYQASTTLIVGEKSTDESAQQQALDYNTLLANQQLAKTYGAIAESRTVGENVIRELDLDLTTDELNEKITVTAIKNTELLEIAVQDTDPFLASAIANTTAEKFAEAVVDIKKVDSISIVDVAVAPDKPIKPEKAKNVLIALLIGLMASLGLAFLLEYLDNTIKTTDDVERLLGLPIMGVIPDYSIDEIKKV